MPLPEPVRGDHWDMDLPEFVGIPADVSIVNALNRRLGHVAVIPVTETPGPAATHVPLDGDAGLTRYDRSYADITALQPVDRALLLRQRGRLAPSELDRLTGQLRIYLGPLRHRRDRRSPLRKHDRHRGPGQPRRGHRSARRSDRDIALPDDLTQRIPRLRARRGDHRPRPPPRGQEPAGSLNSTTQETSYSSRHTNA